MRIRRMNRVSDGSMDFAKKKVTFIDEKLDNKAKYLNNDMNSIG